MEIGEELYARMPIRTILARIKPVAKTSLVSSDPEVIIRSKMTMEVAIEPSQVRPATLDKYYVGSATK